MTYMKYIALILLSACAAEIPTQDDPEVQAAEEVLLGAPSGCKAPSGSTSRACDLTDTSLNSSSGAVSKRCSDSLTHPYYTVESKVNAVTSSGRNKAIATYRQYSGFCTHGRSVAVVNCKNSQSQPVQFRTDHGFRWYRPGERTDYEALCTSGQTFVSAVNEVDIDLWTAF